ncbi:MAG: hypothetical protein JWR22_371 [Herminiimonas sp.]|nr:hypothetical protein [Herminiimonas sp.]
MSGKGSYLINRQAAQAAVAMSLPLITEAMKSKEVGESGFLYIVVMDPALAPAQVSFEEAILYEHAVGDREKWDADYGAFARAKAKVAWMTGRDSHAAQELQPYLMQQGDTVLWGSVVVEGIVVGVSGANPWYDEAFAGTVAMCLRALAKGRVVDERARGLFYGVPRRGA